MSKFKLVSGKFYKDLIEQLEFSKILKWAEQKKWEYGKFNLRHNQIYISYPMSWDQKQRILWHNLHKLTKTYFSDKILYLIIIIIIKTLWQMKTLLRWQLKVK